MLIWVLQMMRIIHISEKRRWETVQERAANTMSNFGFGPDEEEAEILALTEPPVDGTSPSVNVLLRYTLC